MSPCGPAHPRRGVCALCALLALVGTAGAACSAGDRDARPVVAVSVLPQAWFVERIAGDRVRVVVMLPPGANPATYEPGFRELAAATGASLIVSVGHPAFPFEAAWIEAIVHEAPRAQRVDASKGIDGDALDPHVWVSPRHARRMAQNLHAALVALLPREREALDVNAGALLAEIDAVDAELRARLSTRRGDRFLVVHPAWGYLARDYGLVQWAIEAGGREPGARALAERIAEARAAGIPVVFAQPQFDSTAAELVAAEIGARVEWIDPLAPDWAANLRRVGGLLAEAAR